jgi:hypothetical protein
VTDIASNNADIDADEHEGLSGPSRANVAPLIATAQRLDRSCRFGSEMAIIWRRQPNKQSTGCSNTPMSDGCEAS